jgi:nitrogen fixation NifU-like protein
LEHTPIEAGSMELKDPESIAKEIEKAILEGLGKAIGEKVAEHALRPRNAGVLEDPDGEATLSGICEDTIRIQLKLAQDRIIDIAFMTNGCAATIACSSMATELAKGATVGEALSIDGKKVIEALGGLPIEHTHCADLAANTLKKAVRDALQTRNEPWKKLYRSRGA